MNEEVKNTQPDDDAGVYVISVAAEISGMHPQTLRQYDKLGLVSPSRTEGRNRRYSLRDIALLRAVQKLVGEGINHAGIKRIALAIQHIAGTSIAIGMKGTDDDVFHTIAIDVARAAHRATQIFTRLPVQPDTIAAIQG